jgi:hypothetical protein
MAASRIEVEHGFGLVLRCWPLLNAWWKMKVYSSPVGVYYRVGALLANAMNCFRPNQISTTFKVQPPNIYEYFVDN